MSDDFQRLGNAIRERREALGMSQGELAQRTGLHRVTIGRLEGGNAKKRPARTTVQALEAALVWLPGSFDALLAGGEPIAGSYDGRFLRVELGNSAEFVHDLVRKITLEIEPDANVPLARIIRAEEEAERALREAGLLPPLDKPDVETGNSKPHSP